MAQVDAGHPDAVLILEAMTNGCIQSSTRILWALHCLNNWIERDPKAVRALVWRGEIHERLRHPEDALRDYTAAVAADEANYEARGHLAWALLQSKASKSALPHFEHLHLQKPDDAHVFLGLALAHRGIGEPDVAARLMDELLAQHPDDQDAVRERGLLAFSRGDMEQAEQWLRRAVRLDRGDEQANYYLCLCLDQLNRKRSQVFAPLAPWVHLYVWLRRQEARGYRAVYDGLRADAQRFEVLYLELVGNAPKNAKACYEAGKLLLRANRPEDAREWFQQALRIDPQDSASRDALERLDRGGKGP
jgi:predicted Zn-dependent protease